MFVFTLRCWWKVVHAFIYTCAGVPVVEIMEPLRKSIALPPAPHQVTEMIILVFLWLLIL